MRATNAIVIFWLCSVAACAPISSEGGGGGGRPGNSSGGAGGSSGGGGGGGGSDVPVYDASMPTSPFVPPDMARADMARADMARPAPAPDLAPVVCTPACGANQICHNGTCENLPNSCPCPSGSYCDTAANMCKPGCLADSDCGAGDYCDTTARACKPGCRSDSDCPNMADACLAHVCSNSCGSCDDNNPCTSDACVRNKCEHSSVTDGTACPDDGNSCTSDTCQGGACTHSPLSDGTTCSDDGNACTIDVCKSGACTHPNATDGAPCGDDGKALLFCKTGTCSLPSASCDCSGTQCILYSGDSGRYVDNCDCDTSPATDLYWVGTTTSDTGQYACSVCDKPSFYLGVCW
jgi:hypothetical protein